jgi:hypothetical protein
VFSRNCEQAELIVMIIAAAKNASGYCCCTSSLLAPKIFPQYFSPQEKKAKKMLEKA